MKTFTKWFISTLATISIVSGLVYATAIISSVTTQTINIGDTMGAGWFQSVNDYITKSKSCSNGMAITAISTNGTVTCWAVGGGSLLSVYQPDGVTRIGTFIRMMDIVDDLLPSLTGEYIEYVDSNGVLHQITPTDRGVFPRWSFLYRTSDCTGTEYFYNTMAGTNSATLNEAAYYSHLDNKYYVVKGPPACTYGQYHQYYYWNTQNNTCVPSTGTQSDCYYAPPVTGLKWTGNAESQKRLKVCQGAGDCTIK